MIFSLFSFGPLIYSHNLLDHLGFQIFPVLAAVILVSISIAFLSLNDAIRMREADEFLVVIENTMNLNQ